MKQKLIFALGIIGILMLVCFIIHKFFPHLKNHNAAWYATIPNETKDIKKHINVLKHCLKDHPEEWSIDKNNVYYPETLPFTLDHTSGLKLWIKNEKNGLDIRKARDSFTGMEKEYIWSEVEKYIEKFYLKKPSIKDNLMNF